MASSDNIGDAQMWRRNFDIPGSIPDRQVLERQVFDIDMIRSRLDEIRYSRR